MKKSKLTDRQIQVLDYLNSARVIGSGSDRSVLDSLAQKGLVLKHFNSAPGYIYYTWTLTDAGRATREAK